MAELSPRKAGWLGSLIVLGLFGFALDFVLLFVTYLGLAPIAPSVLGEVAASPAGFAAWMALVKLPMTLAYALAVSWRALMALLTTGEVPDPLVRKGRRRRVRDWGQTSLGR